MRESKNCWMVVYKIDNRIGIGVDRRTVIDSSISRFPDSFQEYPIINYEPYTEMNTDAPFPEPQPRIVCVGHSILHTWQTIASSDASI